MKENIPINVKLVLKRIKEELGISKDLELCERLGVKQTTFSSWRSRQTMDYRLIIEFANSHGIDLNFLFFGTGNRDSDFIEKSISVLGNMISIEDYDDTQTQLYEKILYLMEKKNFQRQLSDAKSVLK